MRKTCLNNWLEALRSGEYKQTKKALKDDKGFCPLGVLCDLSKQGQWEPENNSTKQQYFNQINYLPLQVRDWAGISQKENGSLTAFIITYNDQIGLSFLEIADLIEKKYKLTN